MILIYGKNTVGAAVAGLCDLLGLPYDMRDDADIPDNFDVYDTIIPSPGVPGTHAIYSTGKVMAELDFAYQYLPKKFRITAITGTDGKSTTAWMMYSILKKEYSRKKSVYLSGNFGTPFSATVKEILERGEKSGEIVIEVSSFMAYWIGRSSASPFMPDYTIVTNLQSDHLNWHTDLAEYALAKWNLVIHTKKIAIVNTQVLDFFHQIQLSVPSGKHLRIFSQDVRISPCDWTNGEDIIVSKRKKYRLSETQFSGIHNALNLLSVALVAHDMRICSKRLRTYIGDIPTLSHRLETFVVHDGICYVDDSKSTSSQSLMAALSSFGEEKNILLIAGGSDKGDRFEYLGPLFQKRVKALAAMGDTKEQFLRIAEQYEIPSQGTDNMLNAVSWLRQQGISGDVMLLSPGCASFGLFRDYLDRAEHFRGAVTKLIS